ncbi:MAG: hypothetical protein ACP5U1_03725 [Desulfomonilaceae bacterium]
MRCWNGYTKFPEKVACFLKPITTARHYRGPFSADDISVGAGGDCGIDCIAIIGNGTLVIEPEEIKDLERIVEKETMKLKDVNVVIGRSLGFDQSRIDVVDRRISESKEFPDVRELTLVKRKEYSDTLRR